MLKCANWHLNIFVEGLELVRQRVEEKGIKCRLIIEVNIENKEFFNTLPFIEIRHLDGLRGFWDPRRDGVHGLHASQKE